jgi:putative hydrolase of the HAD superfamily
MNKALFWDFDGTLAYARRGWTATMAETLAFFGYPFDYQTVSEHMHRGFTWHAPEKDYAAYKGEKWWGYIFSHLNRLYRKLGISGGYDELNGHVKEMFLDPENYVVYPDTIPTLEKCRELGFKNYVLSNNYPELSDFVEAIGLGGYFEGCVVSANVGYEKPRREIFDIALRLAGHPDICYMIGDNPEADIKGAKAAGIPAILVHSPDTGEADHYFAELSGAAELLCG